MNNLFIEIVYETLEKQPLKFKDLKVVTNYSREETTSYIISASLFREDHNVWIPVNSDPQKSHSDVYEDFFREVKWWSCIEMIIPKTINIHLLDDSEKSNQIIINKLESKNDINT
ncbi:hypothetical protein [Bernardetia sp. MNP-M8]|uniref:hypothetical protein n=1 Tax=Bernardetia sp. MNP-M8 TaxID=3127470 RepID=UPI0030CB6016